MFLTSQVYFQASPNDVSDAVQKMIKGFSFLDDKKRKVSFMIDTIIDNPEPQKTRETFYKEWRDILVFRQNDWIKLMLNEEIVNSLQYNMGSAFDLYERLGLSSKFVDEVQKQRDDINFSLLLSKKISSPLICLTTYDFGSGEQYEAWLISHENILDFKYLNFSDSTVKSENILDFSKWENTFPKTHRWKKITESFPNEGVPEIDLFLQRYPKKSKILDAVGVSAIDLDSENPIIQVKLRVIKTETPESLELSKKTKPSVGAYLIVGSILLITFVGIYIMTGWGVTAIALAISLVLYLKERRERGQ